MGDEIKEPYQPNNENQEELVKNEPVSGFLIDPLQAKKNTEPLREVTIQAIQKQLRETTLDGTPNEAKTSGEGDTPPLLSESVIEKTNSSYFLPLDVKGQPLIHLATALISQRLAEINPDVSTLTERTQAILNANIGSHAIYTGDHDLYNSYASERLSSPDVGILTFNPNLQTPPNFQSNKEALHTLSLSL